MIDLQYTGCGWAVTVIAGIYRALPEAIILSGHTIHADHFHVPGLLVFVDIIPFIGNHSIYTQLSDRAKCCSVFGRMGGRWFRRRSKKFDTEDAKEDTESTKEEKDRRCTKLQI